MNKSKVKIYGNITDRMLYDKNSCETLIYKSISFHDSFL